MFCLSCIHFCLSYKYFCLSYKHFLFVIYTFVSTYIHYLSHTSFSAFSITFAFSASFSCTFIHVHICTFLTLTFTFSGLINSSLFSVANECNSQPCQNGGVCRDVRQGYYCECPGSFTGKNCERREYRNNPDRLRERRIGR